MDNELNKRKSQDTIIMTIAQNFVYTLFTAFVGYVSPCSCTSSNCWHFIFV